MARKYFVDTTISDSHKVYPNGLDFVEGLPVPYANKGTFERVKTSPVIINDTSLTYFNGAYKWNNNLLDVSVAIPLYSHQVIYHNSSTSYYAESTVVVDEDCGEEYCWATAYLPTSRCSVLDRGFGLSARIGLISVNGSLKNGSGCYVGIGKAKIAEIKREIDYLRPDGSTYSVEIDSFYQVQP